MFDNLCFPDQDEAAIAGGPCSVPGHRPLPGQPPSHALFSAIKSAKLNAKKVIAVMVFTLPFPIEFNINIFTLKFFFKGQIAIFNLKKTCIILKDYARSLIEFFNKNSLKIMIILT